MHKGPAVAEPVQFRGPHLVFLCRIDLLRGKYLASVFPVNQVFAAPQADTRLGIGIDGTRLVIRGDCSCKIVIVIRPEHYIRVTYPE